MPLKKVGITKLAYDDIVYQKDGWVDAKKYTPSKFDLIKMKSQFKTFNGWYTGSEWFSLRIRDYDDILYWKKIREVY